MGSEAVTAVTLTANGGTNATDAAGAYTITPSAATGTGGFLASNYNITYATGALTVDPLVAILTGSRTYDGTTTAAFGILTVTNKVGSDDVTVASGSGTLASADVGVQAITSLGNLALGGTAAGNYTLTGASGSVTINLADFRSAASGNWNNTATWQRFDGNGWVAATFTPSSADGTITILNTHTVTVTQAVTVDQVIVESGGQITVTGSVTLTLKTNGDDLQVNSGGKLIVNGVLAPEAGSMVTTVRSGETLGGTGTINGNVTVQSGGILSPGASVGTLTIVGDLTFEPGSTYMVEIGTGTSSDKLDLQGTGSLALGGATLDIGTITNNIGVTIASNATSIVGTFNGLTNGAALPAPNDAYYIHYVNGGGTPGYGSYIVIDKNQNPTSSGVDLRAYQGADGVYVEFVAYDVEKNGNIILAVLGADGTPVWVGTNSVTVSDRYVCRFLVPGLVVGGTYNFAVRDEVGKGWSAPGVTVGAFATEMVGMSLTGLTLSFGSLPDREYEIQWVDRLGATWQTVTNVLADSDHTSVFVLYPKPTALSGFFRILLE